jgi:ATP-dependent Clp endopeptidase proteolytic subunit ClpP
MKVLPWLKIINGNLEDDKPVDLLLDGSIGFNEKTGKGVSAKAFIDYLGAIKPEKEINLLINTLGGAIDEGTAMYNSVLARGNVNTIVVGYAASMGSVIAQAGVKRVMMPGTMMIIHNPQGAMEGDSKDMAWQANALSKAKTNIVNIYHDRSGMSKKKISDMMDETTVMTPEEAEEAGFCDEVADGSPMWNSLEVRAPKNTLQSVLRTVGSFNNRVEEGEGEDRNKQTKDQKTMKTLTAALAAAGLLPSADMTDEATIVTTLNTNLGTFKNAATENTALKGRVTKFEAAQKIRVTAKVDAAITNKLVKAERKDALVAMGTEDETALDSYINDLQELKGSAAPANQQQRRGAPPVPPEKKDDEVPENDQKILDLQNEMKTADGTRRVEISRELRTLRGHQNLFAAPATK